MRQAKPRSIAALLSVLSVCLAACGSSPSASGSALGAAGKVAVVAGSSAPIVPLSSDAGRSSAAAGSGAAAVPPGTVAQTGNRNPTVPPPSAGGMSGAGSAGMLAVTTPAMANTGGAAPAAGSGGAGAAAAKGGDEDAIIRGDDPTDTTGTMQGPFKVAMYTSGFADKPGFLAATVYYPSDAEPPFSHVVFCPGFVSYQTSIQDWGPLLASYGIVIMTIDTNSSSDSVTVRQTALKDALDSLRAENDRSDSPLKGKLHKTRFGLMGWSMGGGASLLNSAMHPEYKSVVTVAEHLATSPGVDEPLKSLKVPVLMFAGTADTAVLGLNMSQPAYETIPDGTTKMLYEVEGADHFFFNTPKALNGVVGKFGLAWQKVFLEGDARYKKLLMTKGPMASDFRTNLQ